MQRIIIKCALAALFWLGTFSASQAQQILSERVLSWSNTQNGFFATDLLRLQPDSLRLLGDFQAGTNRVVQSTNTRLRRVRVATCDTLPVPGSSFQTQASYFNSIATVTRRGRVLIANGFGDTNQPIQLHLLDRKGKVRWTRSLPQIVPIMRLGGLLEAPDRGFFVSIGNPAGLTYLFRLDSLGNTVWQRVLSRQKPGGAMWFYDPAYMPNGNIIFHTPYSSLYPANSTPGTGVMVINQNGDSLTVRQTSPDPLQTSNLDVNNKGTLQPLRDGGFVVAAAVDSAGKGYLRPFLTRLDQNLNVVWSSVYRQQATKQYRFSHPYELADGSLIVLCSAIGSIQQTYYLFQYSAAGVLLQRYLFTSPLLTSLVQSGTGNYGPGFYTPPGLQPLSDSTFMLVDNPNVSVANKTVQRTYLAHIKVAGLRRVVNSAYIPAANSPLATRPTTAAWPAPAYPNPASTRVTVPLPALTGEARLTLTNLLGRRVRAQAVAAGTGTGAAVLDVGGLAPGVYVLALERAGQAPMVQRLTVAGL